MIKNTFLLIAFFCCTNLFAQSLERALISTAGDSDEIVGELQVSWSIGEAISLTLEHPSVHLTQGFQQGAFSPLLPVTLWEFQAWRINSKKVRLTWTAEGDEAFKGFQLERRLEQEEDFKTIAWLNKKEALDYQYLDLNSYKKRSYYRLKMIDKDESFEYSPIRVVDGSTVLDLAVDIAPNPIQDICKLYIEANVEEELSISVYNSQGVAVFQNTFPFQNEISIAAFSAFPAGIYFIQVTINKEQAYFKKVIKK